MRRVKDSELVAVTEMPFGKHKGTLVCELPLDYLRWLITIPLYGTLHRAVAEEWRVRTGRKPNEAEPLQQILERVLPQP